MIGADILGQIEADAATGVDLGTLLKAYGLPAIEMHDPAVRSAFDRGRVDGRARLAAALARATAGGHVGAAVLALERTGGAESEAGAAPGEDRSGWQAWCERLIAAVDALEWGEVTRLLFAEPEGGSALAICDGVSFQLLGQRLLLRRHLTLGEETNPATDRISDSDYEAGQLIVRMFVGRLDQQRAAASAEAEMEAEAMELS